MECAGKDARALKLLEPERFQPLEDSAQQSGLMQSLLHLLPQAFGHFRG